MSTRATWPSTRHTKSSSHSDRRPPAQAVASTAYSSESGRTYHLDRFIGRGGFGEVYLATATPASGLPGKDAGSKVIEVRRLAAQGHKVTVIGERQFWRLAESASRTKKGNRSADARRT